MNESLDPKVAARKTAARFEELARDTEVPQAMRDLAERNIAQMRETYERSKDALEGVLQSWERSFDATNQGAVALNRKTIDIAQRNINCGFDLAKCHVMVASSREIPFSGQRVRREGKAQSPD